MGHPTPHSPGPLSAQKAGGKPCPVGLSVSSCSLWPSGWSFQGLKAHGFYLAPSRGTLREVWLGGWGLLLSSPVHKEMSLLCVG